MKLNELIENVEKSLTAFKDAEAQNAADAKRLEKLAKQIAETEAGIDPENLDSMRDLAALKMQHDHLRKKFDTDAKKRADAAQASAVKDSDISNFLYARRDELVTWASNSVRPFCSDDRRAREFADKCDSVGSLNRHVCAFTGGAPDALRFEALLVALKALRAGNPPWIFTKIEK